MACLALCARPTASQTLPSTDAPQIEQAFRDLADERFSVRQRATDALFRVGPVLEDRLTKLADESPDPEVRSRAQQLLDQFALGLLPDTPPDVIELVRRYLTADATDKQILLNQLSRRNGFGYVVILRLAEVETEGSTQAKAAELARLAGPEVIRSALELRNAGKTASCDRMLEFAAKAGELSCARALAASLLESKSLDAKIAQWERLARQDAEASQRWARPIAMLWRAAGRLDKAIAAVAEVDAELAMTLAIEASDWPKAAQFAEASPDTARRWALLATARRLSGDEAGFDATIKQLRADPDDFAGGMLFQTLALNDHLDVAVDALIEKSQGTVRAFELLVYSGRYEKARQLLADAAKTNLDPGLLKGMEIRLDMQLGRSAQAAASVKELAKAADPPPAFASLLRLAQWESQLSRVDEQWTARCRSHAIAALMVAESSEQRQAAMAWALPHADASVAAQWWEYLQELHPNDPPTARLGRVSAIVYREISADDLAAMARQILAVHPFEPGDTKHRQTALTLLADAFTFAGKPSAAADCIDMLVTLRELMLDWPAAANTAVEHGLWHRAATDLAHADDSPARSWLRGCALLRDNQRAAGEALMSAARTRALTDADLDALATAMKLAGQNDEALEVRRRLIRLAAPGSFTYCSACEALANAAVDQKDWPAAATYWQRYVLTPLYTGGHFTVDRAYIALPNFVHRCAAEAALQRGDDAGVLRHVHAMLAINPLDSQPLIELIDTAQPKRPELARTIFDAGKKSFLDLLSHFPDHPTAHNDLAWLSARCGMDLDEALVHAKRAVELQPRSAAYLDTLAEVCFRRGDRKEALEWMARCETVDPHDPAHQARRQSFEAGPH